MIPPFDPTADESPWDATIKGVSSDDVFKSDGKSTVISVIRMGWNEAEEVPTLELAIPQRFLRFLKDKDTEGTLREVIADYFDQLAGHWRAGDVFKD